MKHWQRWLMAALVVVSLAAALALIASGSQDSLAADGTIYVDADAVGANNGTSWDDAFTTLQPALDGGRDWRPDLGGDGDLHAYLPSSSPGDPRSATFQLKNGVALYGGFDPSVGDVGWEDRDWVSNVTILSGDIGTAGRPCRQQLPRLLPSVGVGPGRHRHPRRLYRQRRQRERRRC